ncbi:hypothetical protein PENSPDRAFT_670214 [Peniophora sp. CONT]|nr:hypothetical protein PENSPDRAFT_670214 [Peniophora sp. CONT]
MVSSEVVAQFLQQLAAYASTYPQLQVLKLHCRNPREMDDPLLLHRLTNELVAGGALSLSVLELRHMVVKWELVSSHLTRLRLLYSAVDPVNALEALSRCTNLLVLDLELDSLEDAYIGHSRSTVHLSVLRYLKLAGDIATCSYFVAFLSMPSSTSIYLSSAATLDELRSSRICALFRKHYRGSGARAVRGLQLNYGRYHGDVNHIVLTVYSHDNPHVYSRDEFGNDAPYLSINVLETTHHQVRKAIVDILHILPTRHIDSIYAGYSLPLPQKTWKTPVLSLLPPLRKACAHPESTASSLLAVMRWVLETKQSRPVAHLRLDCEHTGRGKDDDDGEQKLEIAKAAFQASLSLMAKAKNCGVPLDIFELAGNPGSCMDLLDNLPVKSVYRLLSTGFMFGSHIFNKASTKEDIVRRRAKYGKDSIPLSSGDSDVDAEISAEEEGHLAVDM